MTSSLTTTSLSQPVRNPVSGVIDPGETVDVHLDPPLGIKESPFVVTYPNAPVRVVVTAPATVQLTNQAPVQVGYVLVVVPAIVDKLAHAPWKQAMQAIQYGMQDRQTIKRIGVALGRGFLKRILEPKE